MRYTLPAMSSRRREQLVLLLATIPPVLCACGLQPKSHASPPKLRPVTVYPYTPARLNVHPLTRFISEGRDGSPRIEAHIEMLDASGDESKGWGELLLELYRESGPVEGVGASEQIMRWTIDLSDADRNTEAYDRVTRTYRVTLRGLPATLRPSDPLILKALLITPDGKQISASRRIAG